VSLDNITLGVVHWELYPGPGNTDSVYRGEADGAYLIGTIRKILDNRKVGSIEITHIKDPGIRKKVAGILKESELEIVYSAQPVQLYNEDELIAWTDISSIDDVERGKALDRIFGCVDEAYELGAAKLSLVSGRDPGTESGLALRRMALSQLADSLNRICGYALERAEVLGREPLLILLELCDRDPAFLNQLVGPSGDALSVAREVREIYRRDNFGLLYDLGQMMLIRDISFEGEKPEVLKTLRPYLSHVHIGNCILEKNDPLHGNRHPKLGHPRGAVTEEVLAEFARALSEIGYSGTVSLRVHPYGDEIPEDILGTAVSLLESARDRMDVVYSIGGYYFRTNSFMPEWMFDEITGMRVSRAGIVREEADARARREHIAPDGKLLLISADHPAQYDGSTSPGRPGPGDRQEYIGRIVRILALDGADGVIAPPDVIEDLFIVNRWAKVNIGLDFLSGKVLIGNMNPGGLKGAVYELYDPTVLYRDADAVKEMGLDGVKLTLKLAIPDRYDRYAIRTMDYCSRAIERCGELGLAALIVPLPVEKREGTYELVGSHEELIRAVGVASGLGSSSLPLWIGVPYVDHFDEVARATTSPILVLNDRSGDNPIGVILSVERGMGSGMNVRGACLGLSTLFPGLDDPYAVASGVKSIVHDGALAHEALRTLVSNRGKDLDLLVKPRRRRRK